MIQKTILITEENQRQIDWLLDNLPALFDSEGHVFRCALMNFFREHKDLKFALAMRKQQEVKKNGFEE